MMNQYYYSDHNSQYQTTDQQQQQMQQQPMYGYYYPQTSTMPGYSYVDYSGYGQSYYDNSSGYYYQVPDNKVDQQQMYYGVTGTQTVDNGYQTTYQGDQQQQQQQQQQQLQQQQQQPQYTMSPTYMVYQPMQSGDWSNSNYGYSYPSQQMYYTSSEGSPTVTNNMVASADTDVNKQSYYNNPAAQQ